MIYQLLLLLFQDPIVYCSIFAICVGMIARLLLKRKIDTSQERQQKYNQILLLAGIGMSAMGATVIIDYTVLFSHFSEVLLLMGAFAVLAFLFLSAHWLLRLLIFLPALLVFVVILGLAWLPQGADWFVMEEPLKMGVQQSHEIAAAEENTLLSQTKQQSSKTGFLLFHITSLGKDLNMDVQAADFLIINDADSIVLSSDSRFFVSLLFTKRLMSMWMLGPMYKLQEIKVTADKRVIILRRKKPVRLEWFPQAEPLLQRMEQFVARLITRVSETRTVVKKIPAQNNTYLQESSYLLFLQ